FANRRAEIWWHVRDWIATGGAIPNLQALKQELATPIYWFDATGRKVLESKDDIKKRLQTGSSPDIADALALTFAAPVAVRPRGINEFWYAEQRRQSVRGYDPFELFEQRLGDYDPFDFLTPR